MVKAGVIVEQIERLLNARIAGDRKFPTKPEILIHVRQGLGYAIKADGFESSNIDGLMYANDVYNITFNQISVTTDTNGIKSATLPNIPITFPRGRGIVAVWPSGSITKSYEPIQRKDLDTVAGLTRNNIKRRIMYYQENKSLVFYTTGGGRVANKVDATLVCEAVGGLDEILYIGADTEARIIEYVLKIYGAIGQQGADDQNTDGIDKA